MASSLIFIVRFTEFRIPNKLKKTFSSGLVRIGLQNPKLRKNILEQKRYQMVNFTIEQVRQIMDNQNNIRNISVIAHVDHGKSTLTDSLIAKAGLIKASDAGDKRWTDGRDDEKKRGITIKSTGVTLYYELQEKYLINLIDSPGHVDFSAEVTAALRVTDGALVVVDSVEGVCVQTETVLRQACQEKIRSVLMVNKMDRLILEQKLQAEDIYQSLVRTIERVNSILELYEGGVVDPRNGSVAFGAGKDCWGFTLMNFARPLAVKLNWPAEAMAKRLWGENYYNPKTKKIQTESQTEDGEPLQRTFVTFVMQPIIDLCQAVMTGQGHLQLLEKYQIQLNQKEAALTGKNLLKTVMSKWINAADSLLEMIVTHLPSPREAQVYRTAYLYSGDQNDEVAQAMKNCDPKGPLIMFVSKFVPSEEKGHFLAFGRIFSGTLSQGQLLRVLGPNFTPGKNDDLFEKKASGVKIMMGAKAEKIDDVPCGNTVAISGIDNLLLKTATITNHPLAATIRPMKFSVSPVVRVAISTQKPQDLPKLLEGLKKLQATDNLVLWEQDETGQNLICCCGDLHAEICLNDLRDFAQIPLTASEPLVSYRETITAESQACMTKSANKLNRLYANAQPLNQKLADEIEKGRFVQDEPRERAKAFMEYDWDKSEALRIWSFGPDNCGSNILTELTTGIQNLEQIKAQMDQAWQWTTKQGVLINEPLRGMRVNLMDCKIHEDAVHSGGGQILQAARRLYYACELSAEPRLQEPVFLAEITSPQEMAGQVYQCLTKRRGMVVEENMIVGTPSISIKGYLPVSESFGFAGFLREMTQGQAFPQCTFDHWEIVNGSPLEEGSKAFNIVLDTRKRKGMKVEIPKFNDYNDKL